MKKLRFYYWIAQSLFKRYLFIIIIAAIVGAITVTQASRILGFLPRAKPTVHIGRVGLYTLASLPLDIQSQVSDGLTTIDDSGQPIPNLAESWQVIDQGQTYVFKLKPDITWQDGKTFTSADVNYSFEDVQIETPDSQTVIFKLTQPFTPFPGIVSQPLFKRINTVYAQTFSNTKIIGTGTYSITKLKRNGPNIQTLNIESDLDKKVYHFYNTERAAITAFKLGEIDVLEDLSDPQELANWTNLDITQNINPYRIGILFFNTADPANNLTNKVIRQALAYAVPKTTDTNLRALSPISKDSWVYNPKVKPYDYDLTAAKELLQDQNPNFEITLSTTPAFLSLAEEIKASWEQLGITVVVKLTNIPDTTNFQALLIGQQLPKDPDQYLLWHSTQETNITSYQSAKVDKLLEDGRAELDNQKRKIIYQDFQRFILEDSPAVFLNYLTNYTITR